jgi:hypothetical protein
MMAKEKYSSLKRFFREKQSSLKGETAFQGETRQLFRVKHKKGFQGRHTSKKSL